ncbi:hypothetical protein D3C78_1643250 [compost metagenome]
MAKQGDQCRCGFELPIQQQCVLLQAQLMAAVMLAQQTRGPAAADPAGQKEGEQAAERQGGEQDDGDFRGGAQFHGGDSKR